MIAQRPNFILDCYRNTGPNLGVRFNNSGCYDNASLGVLFPLLILTTPPEAKKDFLLSRRDLHIVSGDGRFNVQCFAFDCPRFWTYLVLRCVESASTLMMLVVFTADLSRFSLMLKVIVVNSSTSPAASVSLLVPNSCHRRIRARVSSTKTLYHVIPIYGPYP